MKKTKLEKGITLVALIITIVVLLILAVVSIGAVKNSGIIGHATNTSDAWKEEQNNEASYLQGYEDMIVESTNGKKVTYTEEGVPVPLEFEVVEGTKDTGLVIKHKTECSEFVWIPVESGTLPSVTGSEPAVVTGSNGNNYDAVPTNLEKAGMPANSTSNDFLTQLTKEYEAMKASVAKYKGFYVGRYEVSIGSDGKAQSVKEETSANASSSSADTWYGLYKLCKTYKTSSVTSSMIWGSQWEAIMDFIGDDKNKTEGRNKGRKTGSVDTDKIKKIYDLIGNNHEWTLTANDTSYRVLRGGYYYTSTYSPSSRIDSTTPTYKNDYYGSRLALYVEL